MGKTNYEELMRKLKQRMEELHDGRETFLEEISSRIEILHTEINKCKIEMNQAIYTNDLEIVKKNKDKISDMETEIDFLTKRRKEVDDNGMKASDEEYEIERDKLLIPMLKDNAEAEKKVSKLLSEALKIAKDNFAVVNEVSFCLNHWQQNFSYRPYILKNGFPNTTIQDTPDGFVLNGVLQELQRGAISRLIESANNNE